MIVNVKMVRKPGYSFTKQIRCDLWWASHAAARWMLDYGVATRHDGPAGVR